MLLEGGFGAAFGGRGFGFGGGEDAGVRGRGRVGGEVAGGGVILDPFLDYDGAAEALDVVLHFRGGVSCVGGVGAAGLVDRAVDGVEEG